MRALNALDGLIERISWGNLFHKAAYLTRKKLDLRAVLEMGTVTVLSLCLKEYRESVRLLNCDTDSMIRFTTIP